MPLELHEELERRLKQILIEELPKLELQFNRFLTWESLSGLRRLDAAVSKGSSTETELLDFVSEDPVSDFVFGFLQDDLWDREFQSDADRRKLLAAVSGYEDGPAVVDRVLAALDVVAIEVVH